MSLQVTQLKNGAVFKARDNRAYRVTKYQHRSHGRTGAHVSLKTTDLVTGASRDFTFDAGDRVEEADVERRPVQFLYKDNDHAYFMDLGTFEQVSLSLEAVGEGWGFLKEAMVVVMLYFEGQPVLAELPHNQVYGVTETEPGVKGNRVSAATKPATIESGAVIKVPLFVGVGDKIKVDTRKGEYLGRV